MHGKIDSKPEIKEESQSSNSPLRSAVDQAIIEAVRSLRYGSVEIVVHDGVVMQIERRERIRYEYRKG